MGHADDLDQWFSTWAVVPPGASGNIWGCYWHLVGTGQDAAEHPVMHRTALTTKNYLAPNVYSAEVEKS